MYAKFGNVKVLVNAVKFGSDSLVVNGWYTITKKGITNLSGIEFEEVEINKECYTCADFDKLEKLFEDM